MISGSDLHSEVTKIAAMGDRLCGGEVEHQVMEYLHGRFVEIGLKDAAIEWFDMHRWRPKRVEVELLREKKSLRCKPIWYAAPTAPEGLQGECVYCGYGMPHEFGAAKGKIAVIDSRILLHFWPTYRFFKSYESAVDAGAAAMVVVMDAPGDLMPIFTSEEEKHDGPIPALTVCRSDGTLLKEHISKGKTELSLIMEAKANISRTGDVVGMLPGKTDEYLIVGAHHDSIYKGAIDNAGGLAALMAIAKEFAGRSEPLQKNIIFATHPGHELLIGAREFIKNRTALLEKTAAYITLDGIGADCYEEIDGKIEKLDRDEVRGAFISPNPILAEIILPLLKKHRLQPSALLSAEVMCPNEDLEGRFLEAGVPIVDIIGKPIWYHTEEDTPDKCTPDQLERGATAQMEMLEQIDAIPATKMRESNGKLQDVSVLVKPGNPKLTPGIGITYLPENPKAGDPSLIYLQDFDDREGILVDMKWDIAGDNASRGPAVLHVFDAPGEYPIKLTVVNDLGAEGSCEKTVVVT